MTAPAWLTARPFAHRGLHGDEIPENSLAAVAAAVDAGYPVEIDVRVSSDGRVVVFHDDSLLRMTGRGGTVEELRFVELAGLRLGRSGEGIPLLEAVLDIVSCKGAVLVEIKNRGRPGVLEENVARLVRRQPDAQVGVMSFNPLSLGWMARHAADIPRGQLSCRFETETMPGWRKFLLSNYLANAVSRPHFLAHQWDRLPACVPAVLRAFFHLPVLGWTCRSEMEDQRARRHVDNVIFEGYRAAIPPRVADGV